MLSEEVSDIVAPKLSLFTTEEARRLVRAFGEIAKLEGAKEYAEKALERERAERAEEKAESQKDKAAYRDAIADMVESREETRRQAVELAAARMGEWLKDATAHGLTKTEKDVFARRCNGESQAAIASALGVTPGRVSQICKAIAKKWPQGWQMMNGGGPSARQTHGGEVRG